MEMKLKYGLLILFVVFGFLMVPGNVFALEDSQEASVDIDILFSTGK